MRKDVGSFHFHSILVLCFKAVYRSGMGTLGCVCGDLGIGDARRRTWGHQVWDAGMCGTGTGDVKYRDVRDVNDYCKSRRYMQYQSLSL